MRYPVDLTLGATISEVCNLECSFCSRNLDIDDFPEHSFYSQRMSNKFGKFMTSETFSKILENIDLNISRFFILGLGEPLLNPEFPDIIRSCAITNAPVKEFIIYTNGIELSPEMEENLLEILGKSEKNFTFVFSVGAFRRNTYKKIKNKDKLDQVVSNIMRFLDNINKTRYSNIFVTVQFVLCEENSGELQEFHDFWKKEFKKRALDVILENDTEFEIRNHSEYTNSISVIPCIGKHPEKDMDLYGKSLKYSGLDQIILNKGDFSHGDRFFKDGSRRPACPDLFRYPFIFIDGRLSICCYDIDFTAEYGNLTQSPLSEIFLSEKAKKWRKNAIEAGEGIPEVCRKCVGSDHIYLKKSEIIEYCNKFEDRDMSVKYFTRLDTGSQYLYENLIIYGKIEDIEIISTENLYSENIPENIIYRKHLKTEEFRKFRINRQDNTLLPCAHWFSTLIIKDGNRFNGCDLSPILHEIIKKDNILRGDYSALPEKCLNCIERQRPDSRFFNENRDIINKNWKDLIYSRQELDIRLPDFNNIDLRGFLDSQAVTYRIGWERIILKYSHDKEKLLEITNIEEFPEDAYIMALSAKHLFINGIRQKAFQMVSEANKLNPCSYFRNVIELSSFSDNKWENIFFLNKYENSCK